MAPFIFVSIPALGDTLNHLARMHVLANIATSPDLQRAYSVAWAPIPYLAMDAIVPLLVRIMPIYLAGKIFVCACVLLPAIATATLHRVLHRRWSLVPAAAFLLGTNYLLALGFLNYLFSAGAAVLLFAFWAATPAWPRSRRVAVFTPLLTLLYFGHAFAALAYCLSVAGNEIARSVRAGRARWRTNLANVAAAAAQAIPALAFAATLDVSAGYVGTLDTQYGDIGAKLMALASPLLFLIDWVHAASVLAVLTGFFVLRRQIRLAPAGWPACLAVFAAALAVPHVLASTWGTDYRLPLVACMLFIGSASVPRSSRLHWPLVALLGVLLTVRAADDFAALRLVDRQIAETRNVLAALPRGARLLTVNGSGHGTGREWIAASTIWHMPLVAVIDRDAFVPTLFNGLTTVHIRPAFRLSSTPNGLPISPALLADDANLTDEGGAHGDGFGARDYARGWPAKFDFVLYQHFGDPSASLPRNLQIISQTPDMDLYSIHH